MSNIGFEAKPISRVDIRHFATQVREVLGFKSIPYLDVEGVLDFVLPSVLPGFAYEVRPRSEMGTNHGLADPENRFISLREDVFVGMCDGQGRDRLTVMHEVGHLLLHTKDRIVLRRGTGKPVSYCDPEWQASCFAGELLVAHTLISECGSPADAVDVFGVSNDAAVYQWRQYQNAGLL